MTYLRLAILAATAFAAYTLGARAGRREYRHIKKNAKKAWRSRGARAARRASSRGARAVARNIRH